MQYPALSCPDAALVVLMTLQWLVWMPQSCVQVARVLGVREFFPSQKAMSALFGAACLTESLACVGTIASVSGCNPANIDPALYPLYMAYFPSGTAGCDI